MMQLAKFGNAQLNLLTHYDVNAGLATAEQVTAAELILGIMQPLLEESLKAAALVAMFILASRRFRTFRDGMYYAAAVGLGYGIVENQLYIHGAVTNSELGIAIAVTITRSLIFGLNHVIWCTPFALALAKVREKHAWFAALVIPLIGFACGFLMHGLHNASFLWVQLQRSYGVFALVSSLTIYAVACIIWLVIAFRSKPPDASLGSAT